MDSPRSFFISVPVGFISRIGSHRRLFLPSGNDVFHDLARPVVDEAVGKWICYNKPPHLVKDEGVMPRAVRRSSLRRPTRFRTEKEETAAQVRLGPLFRPSLSFLGAPDLFGGVSFLLRFAVTFAFPLATTAAAEIKYLLWKSFLKR